MFTTELTNSSILPTFPRVSLDVFAILLHFCFWLSIYWSHIYKFATQSKQPYATLCGRHVAQNNHRTTCDAHFSWIQMNEIRQSSHLNNQLIFNTGINEISFRYMFFINRHQNTCVHFETRTLVVVCTGLSVPVSLSDTIYFGCFEIFCVHVYHSHTYCGTASYSLPNYTAKIIECSCEGNVVSSWSRRFCYPFRTYLNNSIQYFALPLQPTSFGVACFASFIWLKVGVVYFTHKMRTSVSARREVLLLYVCNFYIKMKQMECVCIWTRPHRARDHDPITPGTALDSSTPETPQGIVEGTAVPETESNPTEEGTKIAMSHHGSSIISQYKRLQLIPKPTDSGSRVFTSSLSIMSTKAADRTPNTLLHLATGLSSMWQLLTRTGSNTVKTVGWLDIGR